MIYARDPRPYLQDILDCIAHIKRYSEGIDLTTFLNNDMLQDAIIRRIEVIGEAV